MSALKQSLDSKVSQESVIKAMLKVWQFCLLAVQGPGIQHRENGNEIYLIAGKACRKSALRRVKQLQSITQACRGLEEALLLASNRHSLIVYLDFGIKPSL